jgi:DNA-binding IclR family transcriptional regulator
MALLRLGPRTEAQKLLALAAKEGTLTTAQIQAALGLSKKEADEALTNLRREGLAEMDLDEAGAPIYRVQQAALEARKNKGW